ncbi:hypothetical protein [Georgfuchsia toluolica]|uniref:hypothetical protein n=1 Tax=Georgfuchsia toluolica TaxID=424218 RepID=UPI001C73812E|nr:hypothetical protein [Georgfuchsia toluolica]
MSGYSMKHSLKHFPPAIPLPYHHLTSFVPASHADHGKLMGPGSSEIPDCQFGSDNSLKPAALDIPIECDHCHTRIYAAVATSFEGADYLYHFCGPQCIEARYMKANLL